MWTHLDAAIEIGWQKLCDCEITTDQTAEILWSWRSWPTISVGSWSNRRVIVDRSPQFDGLQSSCDGGHQFHLSTASNSPEFFERKAL